MTTLCRPKHKIIAITRPLGNQFNWGWSNDSYVPPGIKRFRVPCPDCGRKVFTSVSFNDGEAFHSIPPHKPKLWWKKRRH